MALVACKTSKFVTKEISLLLPLTPWQSMEVTKLTDVGYNFGQVKISSPSVLLVELKRSSVVLLDSTVY